MLSTTYSIFTMLIFKLLLHAKATPQQILVPRAIFRSRNNWLPLINYCVREAEAPLVRETICVEKEAGEKGGDERKGTSKLCAKGGERK